MPDVFIFGCRAPTVDFQQILDPCNCSSYFVQVTTPVPSRDVQVCGGGQLWNHEAGACESRDSVLSRGLCNRKVPWNRCREATDDASGDGFRTKMKSTCIETGRYNSEVADRLADHLSSYKLPVQFQSANVELMVASFVAGCVVTLFLVAIILTICGLPTIKYPKTFGTSKKTKTVQVKKKKIKSKTPASSQSRQTVTMQDDTVEYENVNTGQNVMAMPENPSPPKKPPYSKVNKTDRSMTTKTKTSNEVLANQSPSFTVAVDSGRNQQAIQIEPKHTPKPAGFAPKPPTKPPSNNKGSPTRQALKLPSKPSAKQQPSYGYLHPT